MALSLSVFEECTAAASLTNEDEDTARTFLECLSDRVQALEAISAQTSMSPETTQWFVLFAGALVFMMQTGFAVSVCCSICLS